MAIARAFRRAGLFFHKIFKQVTITNIVFETFILNLSNSNKLIIVEGKKDRKALENFGIFNIVELNKNSISGVVDFVSKENSECIILTDLDREGKKIMVN